MPRALHHASSRTKSDQSVWDRVEAYNRGRLPDLVDRKYRAMRGDAFVFFRGSAHLFWEDWAAMGGHTLDDAPLAWCCADLHLENFGSYRGDNGLTYFDVNDFDEGALAPATRDPARFLTSARLAGERLGLSAEAIGELEASFLDSYAAALATGKARWIERAIATGWIRDLLRSVKDRTQQQLLEDRTTTRRGLRLLVDGKHTFKVPAAERQRIARGIGKFAAAEPDPDFYRVLDVVGRIAGTGSLGLPRYAVLIRGPGGARRRRILDVKAARPSAVALHLRSSLAQRQPWRDDAERITQIQRRMQAIPPALLSHITIGSIRFVVRELQPTDDRLNLEEWGSLGRLQRAVATMGELTAWAQLRGASRGGADGIDALIALAHSKPTRRRLITFAREYARRAKADWEEFRESARDRSARRSP